MPPRITGHTIISSVTTTFLFFIAGLFGLALHQFVGGEGHSRTGNRSRAHRRSLHSDARQWEACQRKGRLDMITTVNWKYIILNGDDKIGYRVKRRTGGSPPPTHDFGTDMPMSDSWSRTAKPQLPYGPRNYIFVFWSLTEYDAESLQSEAHITSDLNANESHHGGQWTISANAYYVWDFGPSGPGPNALLIDAFDIEAGDFIPDDFVKVNPDPKGTLAAKANNGYINTSTEIAQGSPPPAITVTALDLIARQFARWLYWPHTPLFTSNNPQFPATVGSPNPRDIVVHNSDTVVAIALYDEVKPPVLPRGYNIIDWLWYIKTHGGVTPGGPPGPPISPWLQEFATALALENAANAVSPRLRARVLEVALEQMSIASATLKEQISALQRK